MNKTKIKKNSVKIKEVEVGERVLWFGDLEKAAKGTIRWLGKIEEISDGLVAGVELRKALGSNDGSWNHKRYFNCPTKHGLFVDVSGLLRESDVGEISSEEENEILNKVSIGRDSDASFDEEDDDNEIAKNLIKDLEKAINAGSEKKATECVKFLINSKIKCQIKLSTKPLNSSNRSTQLVRRPTTVKQGKEIELNIIVEKGDDEEKFKIVVPEIISIIEFKIKLANKIRVEPYILKLFCGDMKKLLKDDQLVKQLDHKNKFIAVVTNEK